MPKTAKVNLKGKKYGFWKVLRLDTKNPSRHTHWICKCLLCKTKRSVSACNLRSDGSKSCGCLRKILLTKHGMVGTSEYKAWYNAKTRCYNKNASEYKNYGGRGIKVCQAIRNSFVSFLKCVGTKPDKTLTIDRKNNNGHYSCGKCKECKNNGWTMNLRWATPLENSRNRIR